MTELELIAAALLRYIYHKPYAWKNRDEDLLVLDALLVRQTSGGAWQIVMLMGVEQS